MKCSTSSVRDDRRHLAIATPTIAPTSGSTSSYNDTLTYNSAAWVVTLVLVILTILAGVALASVRTIEKVIRNYQLDTSMSSGTCQHTSMHHPSLCTQPPPTDA